MKVEFQCLRNLFNVNMTLDEAEKLNKRSRLNVNSIHHPRIRRLNKTYWTTRNNLKRDIIYQIREKNPQYFQLKRQNKISGIINDYQDGLSKKFEGKHRFVYIHKITGHGYKFYKPSNKCDDSFKDSDARLNDLLRNPDFYKGKYSRYATNKKAIITDDVFDKDCSKISIFHFERIPQSEQLRHNERIPLSALLMLEDIGFIIFDVQPHKFIKVRNEEGKYDYLPIDGKSLGFQDSNSDRTQTINHLKNLTVDMKDNYYRDKKYVDENK